MTEQTEPLKIKTNQAVEKRVPMLFPALLVSVCSIVTTRISAQASWAAILAAFVVFVYVSKKCKVSFARIGFAKSSITKGLVYGLAGTAIVVVVLSLAYALLPTLFIDSRYNKTTQELLWLLVVFIPFHTVLFEEVLFRGFIYTYANNKKGHSYASIYSSLLFGLWHIGSSLALFRSSQTVQNSVGAQQNAGILITLGTIVATASAGYIFCYVKNKSNSLVAPIVLHWGINASAAFFAFLANRG